MFTKNDSLPNDDNVEFTSSVEKFTKKLVLSSEENIWLVGGAELFSVFLRHKLVDEIVLSVIPIILGKGIPLFQNIDQEVNLELIKTTEYNGLVELTYKIMK